MKNIFTFLIPLFLGLTPPLSIHAQNALGCNGIRYINDIATDVTSTTVQYGSNINAVKDTQKLMMDIIQPKDDTLSRRPVIVLAFGGGFVGGKRQDMLIFANTFAKRGYVTTSIDYRLWDVAKLGAPDSSNIVPVMIQALGDMKASIRYLYKSAREGNPYKIDTNNIIVGGISAGAIMAMHVAHMDSTDNIPAFMRTVIANQGGFEGKSGNPGYSSKVKGVINMSGGLYRAEFIDAGDPSFVSYHGTADNVVPYDRGINVYNFISEGSATCQRQAQKVRLPSYLYTVQGGLHSELYGPNHFLDLLNFLAQGSSFMQKVICGIPISSSKDLVEKSLKISPNPAFDETNFTFDENTEGGYRISIYDLMGRQVFNSGRQNNPVFTVKKEQIGKGLFIAKVQFDKEQQIVTRKIVFE
jgi:Secretion system C-terminal sorting domain/alpha/beta hydrolase fold